jgi:hypothetical protein
MLLFSLFFCFHSIFSLPSVIDVSLARGGPREGGVPAREEQQLPPTSTPMPTLVCAPSDFTCHMMQTQQFRTSVPWTPTATWENAVDVPTLDTVPNTCPEGLPGGYGSVTPSADWVLRCSQCLPRVTSLPSLTPRVTMISTPTPACVGCGGGIPVDDGTTATPDGTTTVTPDLTQIAMTSTPDPDKFWWTDDLLQGGMIVKGPAEESSRDFGDACHGGTILGVIDHNVAVRESYSCNGNNVGYSSVSFLPGGYGGVIAHGGTTCGTFTHDSALIANAVSLTGWDFQYPYQPDEVSGALSNPQNLSIFSWVGNWRETVTYSKIQFLCKGGTPPQPTPTVQPTGNSFCSVVKPKEDDVSVVMPRLVKNPVASCSLLGGWTIDMSWMASSDHQVGAVTDFPAAITIPGVNLCFREYLITNSQIGSWVIDFNAIFLAAGVIWGFRQVMRGVK